MEEYRFKTQINSKFYLSSPLTSRVKKIWIVFHGYGQLGKYFIKKFNTFSSDENVFIAPQALNQFYLKGFTGRVGSTWMTSEDREQKIEDYVNYLLNLDDLILSLENSNAEINVLGFSQGGNTMSRYLLETKLEVNKIVFWGSRYAADIDQYQFFKKFDTSSLIIVYGLADELITEAKINIFLEDFYTHNRKPLIISFKGGHEICANTFKKIF